MADVTDVSSLPFPELTDQPNAPDNIQDLAEALDHIVVPKYATSTARDNDNTSPVAGDMCYLNDQAGYYTYNGAGWERWKFGQQFKVKTASESVFNNSTLQTDDHLTNFVLLPGVRYKVRGQLFVNSHSSTDFKFIFNNLSTGNFPTNDSAQGFLCVTYAAGDGNPNASTKRWSQTQIILTDRESFDGPNFVSGVNLDGILVNTTGGSLTTSLQWAQNSAASLTTFLLHNSWVEFERT